MCLCLCVCLRLRACNHSNTNKHHSIPINPVMSLIVFFGLVWIRSSVCFEFICAMSVNLSSFRRFFNLRIFCGSVKCAFFSSKALLLIS